ncbi:peptidoglycan-binding domain-containing protein [Aetokthonos hydrillicola]|nr:peptidoglycan-binding protein [Aetokthonos hydrillicola]MBO3463448.1 peptidoglycan-binding protein [Aetokthonos hydrillicola CCALA 1050]
MVNSSLEESQNIGVVGAGVDFKFFTNFLNWKKLSSSATIPVVSVALTLSVLSLADQASALEKAGNQGVEITSIQRCLQKIGYFRGPVTGKFGSLTKNAVIQFQKAHGLAADGLVGSRTEQLLQSECQSKTGGSSRVGSELQLGSRGLAVTNLQKNLQQLGFFNGPITGYFGSETQQAVIRFQQSRGIRSAGIVGPKTTEAIRVSLNQLRRRVSYEPVEPPQGIGGDNLPIGISFGTAGAEVVELQRSLRQLGYFNSNPTGYFGSSTRDAVVRFQQTNGITPNGIADTETLAAITNALGNQNSYTYQNSYISQNPYPVQNPDCLKQNNDICLGERSKRVTAVQQRLQQLGFFQGNVSGRYGPNTRDAVIQFQKFQGLAATGVVNYQTWQALNISNFNNSTTGNSNSKKSYVVIVPIHHHDTLYQVRQYVPEAFAAESRLGAYVNAGRFSERLDAEKLSDALRSHGLDARVEYL